MNLHQLQYLRALAQYQSFSKAADSLYITQPTLSYAINTLEKELGTQLFVRTGRSAVLTPAGREFFEYVNSSLSSLEQGVSLLQAKTSPNDHLIRIVTDRIMVVLDEIKMYKSSVDCSTVSWQLEKQNSNIEASVMSDRYDIGFQSKLPTTAGLEYVELPDAEFLLLVPKDHSLANQDSVDLRDVDWDQNVVMRSQKSLTAREHLIQSMYQQVGYDPKRATSHARTTLAVACMVEAGFGIAIVPSFSHLKDFDLCALHITYPKHRSTQYMIRKVAPAVFNAASGFFSYVAEAYGQKNVVRL